MLGKLFRNFSAPAAPAAMPPADTGPPAELLRAAAPVLSAEEVLERQGEVAEAERRLRAAVAADVDDAVAIEALGAFLLRRRRFDEAQALLDEALARLPDDGGLLATRGHLAQLRLQVPEAIGYFRLSLAARPGHARTRYHLGTQLLLAGEMREAFMHMAVRLELPGHNTPYWVKTLPRWHGEPLAGKHLLVEVDWGGLGDEVQFARFIEIVHRDYRPASLQVACSDVCRRLIEAIPGVDRAFTTAGAISADYHIGLMDIPGVIGTELETIPAPPRYLSALPGDVAYWGRKLAAAPQAKSGVLKVGLCWAAGFWHGRDGRSAKSIPLPLLAALGSLPDVRFISLQKGSGRDELPCPGVEIEDYTEDLEDMGDTAALVENLDVVLTVDTAVAHIAGALGKPVIMLLMRESGMFWLLEREDTPWYPGMRLLRQARSGEWQEVCARAVEALRTWPRPD
ncbi:MAG: glycosyltransferase 9 family protein [Betaproteobacteria bacterium]|nr:glycosyltransferase 9 family protein [Betaproteobacteria bacterium]